MPNSLQLLETKPPRPSWSGRWTDAVLILCGIVIFRGEGQVTDLVAMVVALLASRH